MSIAQPTSAFETFRALHESGLLRIANAWDAGSARLIESLGAKAIATTSAGMAWAAGYPDGNRMPESLVVSISEAIARVIQVPLSIDIEGGYSSDPAEVANLVVRLADKGVVGVNLEDGAEPADLLARKIEATKTALTRAGLAVFVNARTDVYLANLAPPPRRVDEVLRRARRYAGADADGLFVPAVTALPEIREIWAGTRLPLNVLAWEGLAAPDALEEAGVRRLSAGSGISALIWAETRAKARAFLEDGTLLGEAASYPDLQRLFG